MSIAPRRCDLAAQVLKFGLVNLQVCYVTAGCTQSGCSTHCLLVDLLWPLVDAHDSTQLEQCELVCSHTAQQARPTHPLDLGQGTTDGQQSKDNL